MNKQLLNLIKIAGNLDTNGDYKNSDSLFVKISQYYIEQSLTKVPNVHYVEFDELDDEIYENQKNYYTKKPNLVVKQYFDLTDEDDVEEGKNLEALLHGPDDVSGPAYTDPGNLSSSPSMTGDLKSFTYKETYQKNVDEGKSYLNRLPLR